MTRDDDAAIAAPEGSQACERLLRARLERDGERLVPRQRHWSRANSSAADPARSQRRLLNQRCSLRSPSGSLLLPLSRQANAQPARTDHAAKPQTIDHAPKAQL